MKIRVLLAGFILLTSASACLPSNYNQLMRQELQKTNMSVDGKILFDDARFPERSFAILPPPAEAPLNWRAVKEPNMHPISYRPIVTGSSEVVDKSVLLYATVLPKNVYGQSFSSFNAEQYIRMDIEELGRTIPGSETSVATSLAKGVLVKAGGVANVIAIQDKDKTQTVFRAYIMDDIHDAVGIVMLMTPTTFEKEYAKKMSDDYFKVIQSFEFKGSAVK